MTADIVDNFTWIIEVLLQAPDEQIQEPGRGVLLKDVKIRCERDSQRVKSKTAKHIVPLMGERVGALSVETTPRVSGMWPNGRRP
jgi:hypothetical protein